MPEYIKRCDPCDHSFSAFATMRTSSDIKCPKCGGATRTDFTAQGVPAIPAHDLHGTRQRVWEERFHPSEVQEARKLLGGRAAACIQDNGKVVCKHRDDAKAYFRRIGDLNKARADRAAKKAETANTANP